MQEDSLIHYTDTLGIERTLNRYNSEEDDYYVARRDSSDMIPELNGDGNGNNWASQSVWVTKQNVPMMLQTLWDQEDDVIEYNRYCPRSLFGKTPVGCVPVAVGQIMAYHEYPSVFPCDGYSMNWHTLKTVHPYV